MTLAFYFFVVAAADGQDQGYDSSGVAKKRPDCRLGPVGEDGAAPKGCRSRDQRTGQRW